MQKCDFGTPTPLRIRNYVQASSSQLYGATETIDRKTTAQKVQSNPYYHDQNI